MVLKTIQAEEVSIPSVTVYSIAQPMHEAVGVVAVRLKRPVELSTMTQVWSGGMVNELIAKTNG